MVNSDNSQKEHQINDELFQKLRTFIATTNNYLMSIPVEGDRILSSAKLMNEAHDLIEALDSDAEDE